MRHYIFKNQNGLTIHKREHYSELIKAVQAGSKSVILDGHTVTIDPNSTETDHGTVVNIHIDGI